MFLRLTTGFAIATVLGFGFANRASACSYILHLEAGWPAPDATGVSTTVAPWVHGSVDSSELWLETATGDPVALDVTGARGPRTSIMRGELTAPLEPLTPYVLRATAGPYTSGPRELTVRFTTGDGPDPVPETPQFHFQRYRTAVCDSPLLCMRIEGERAPSHPYELTILDPTREPERRQLVAGGWIPHVSGNEDTCYELRRRNESGVLSEATTICASETPSFSGPTMGGGGPECVDGRIRHEGEFLDDSGCTIGHTGGAAPAATWWGMLIVVLVARMRRHRGASW